MRSPVRGRDVEHDGSYEAPLLREPEMRTTSVTPSRSSDAGIGAAGSGARTARTWRVTSAGAGAPSLRTRTGARLPRASERRPVA